MGKPAARVGDMHVCPMVTPGVPPIPHVGGPILPPGKPTVLIGGMPAATMGSMCVCTGPPDSIILGSIGVLIGGQPAARMGDMCAHGGTIVLGCPTVLIGEMMPSVVTPGIVASTVSVMTMGTAEILKAGTSKMEEVKAQVGTLTMAALHGAPFCEKCEAAKKELQNLK